MNKEPAVKKNASINSKDKNPTVISAAQPTACKRKSPSEEPSTERAHQQLNHFHLQRPVCTAFIFDMDCFKSSAPCSIFPPLKHGENVRKPTSNSPPA